MDYSVDKQSVDVDQVDDDASSQTDTQHARNRLQFKSFAMSLGYISNMTPIDTMSRIVKFF